MSFHAAVPIHPVEGVLFVSTDVACGKTAVIAGVAAALNASGFRVQALKPLAFTWSEFLQSNLDQQFINQVSQQYIPHETLGADSPWEVPMPLWNRVLDHCLNLQYPCLIEAPGQVATPWQVYGHTVVDGFDVAEALSLSVVLVSRSGQDYFEKTRSALTFIQARGLQPVGFIRVQTTPLPEAQDIEAQTLLLAHQFKTSFLGNLPYSPSIQVHSLQQGNIIRLVEENIDLLPLQMGMKLTI